MLRISGQLIAGGLPAPVVHELLGAYSEAKANFYRGGLRLSAVEGGRFCEAAYRLIEHITGGTFTPLGQQIDADQIGRRVAAKPIGSFPDSIRLHIPRALRVVYDVRNNRDAAHLADGIDPNLQDATVVIGVLDWILAEFIRLYHRVGPDEAYRIVEQLVARRTPVVQEFKGFLKILDPTLGPSDRVCVLLYARGSDGATPQELSEWCHPRQRANLTRTLRQLTDDKSLIHWDGSTFFITASGIRYVEKEGIAQPS